MTIKIKITQPGIFGLPIDEQKGGTGEYPIGHELTLQDGAVPPAAWKGKYEVTSGKLPDDAEFITGDAAQRGTESKDQADQPRRGRQG